jgi:hypothetical protein
VLSSAKNCASAMRNICPVHGLFNYVNPWPETRNHPLASPLLSAGRRDAAVWTSRLRSGNSVWRHVLRCFVLRTSYFVCALGAGCPSTSTSCRCRLAFAQAQIAAAGALAQKTKFYSTMGLLFVLLKARTDSSPESGVQIGCHVQMPISG